MKFNKFIKIGVLSIVPTLLGINNANAGFLSSYVLGVPTSFSPSSMVGASMGSKRNKNEVSYSINEVTTNGYTNYSYEPEPKVVYQDFEGFIYPGKLKEMSNQLLVDLFDDGSNSYKFYEKDDKFTFNLNSNETLTIPFKWSKIEQGNSIVKKTNPPIDLRKLDLIGSDSEIKIHMDETNIYIKNESHKLKEIYLINHQSESKYDNKYMLLVGGVNKKLNKLKEKKEIQQSFQSVGLLMLTVLSGVATLGLIRKRKQEKEQKLKV